MSPVIQDSDPKKFWYHFKENPGGGNCRYSAELKDIGITIKIGKMRNSRMHPQNP
jgi:hypothetical protein